MTKKLILAFALFSLSAVGCGNSACENAADQSEDCGFGAATSEQLELCEALADDDALQACVDCRDTAADTCAAFTNGDCDSVCN